MYQIITKKKRGLELTKEEIYKVVDGYTRGSIPDYQMSALLMAICLKGMSNDETANLTMAMAESGDMLDLSHINNITADKHSTGGVGDKTSLIIGPIVAANGVAVAKMSGRGLGHTGGTIDKLESICGFQTEISEEEFTDIVNSVGIAIVGQSAQLAPADKKLYALRDVTATVDNVSLIASSIMSKKLAAGSQVIVLDVKTGSGAFMKELADSKKLAEIMVHIGKTAGRKMYALITDMNQPLGNYVGNKLEVYEAVKILKGQGPEDLLDASLYLSALILCGAGKVNNIDEGYLLAKKTIECGAALEKFKEFVNAQHGDPDFVNDIENFCKLNRYIEVKADKDGYVNKIDTEAIGMASMYLGGGRATKDDIIDPDVGLYVSKKLGDKVSVGDTMVKLYISEKSDADKAIRTIKNAYLISDDVSAGANSHVYGYYDENSYHDLLK
ncbi:MAG: thymidine phosphorylase [Clostridia bacterium]|nr:thymidine phosphorylase [Clostridia bacterium]